MVAAAEVDFAVVEAVVVVVVSALGSEEAAEHYPAEVGH